MDKHLIAPAHVKTFVFGGRAKFIVQHGQQEYTLRVAVTSYDKHKFNIYLNQEWMGAIYKVAGVTLDQKIGTAEQRLVVQEILDSVLYENYPHDMHFYHIGICGICGRDLTDPYSIHIGIGPTCRKRVGLVK
jgi:hypothetical protein